MSSPIRILKGPRQTLTFPLWVYGAVKVGLPPQVFVLSTFIFAGGVVLVNVAVTHRRRAA
jgi:spermidine/putrescine transport system permease protein